MLAEVEGQHPSSSGWVYVPCPFCGDGKRSKRRLSFSFKYGSYRCWNPGCYAYAEDGFVIDSWVGPNIEVGSVRPDRPKLKLPDEYVPLTDSVRVTVPINGHRYYDYLVSRHVSDQAVVEAEIGFCTSGPYGGMVIVPARQDGVLAGFAGRAIVGKRFKNASNAEGGVRAMLNGDVLKVETDEPVYIVEGPFDCLRHWPYAVACFGKPTHAQIDLLAEARRPLFIVLDADAWAESWALACKLRVFHGVDAIPVYLPPGCDPGGTPSHALALLAGEAARKHEELPMILQKSPLVS